MARGLNKCTFIGNLGSDPEVRSTTGGARVATFSIGVSEEWKDKDGNKQERTEWVRVVVWDKLAEIVEQYVHKGDKLYVEGKMANRKWQDKDGNDRYTTEIVINGFGGTLLMLGSPSGNGNGGGAPRARDTKGLTEGIRRNMSKDTDFEDFRGALDDEDDDLPF